MTLWWYCPNPKCSAPPLEQGAPNHATPGDRCVWCKMRIEAMPPKAYEEDGS